MSYHNNPVGIVADASIYGIPCAQRIYGEEVIRDVLDSESGRPVHEDRLGDEIGVTFEDNETCKCCLQLLLDCTGEPYGGTLPTFRRLE